MDRNLLKNLMEVKDYPCISIMLPTFRTAPENQKNAIRLKKLVREATDRLETEFGKRDSKYLVDAIKELASGVDISRTLDGLALLVNKDIKKVIDIPFKIKERVIIDKTFATRDLIMAVNRGTNYYVLDLSLHRARLLYCTREHAEEIREKGFPMESEIPLLQLNPTDFSREKKKQIREFFNKVDKAYMDIYHLNPASLVIAGVQKNLSLFKDVLSVNDLLFDQIEGNHENVSVHDMGKKAWEKVEVKMKEERHNALNELQNAISLKRFASGLPETWRLANEGRVQLLIIEQEFQQTAGVKQDGQLTMNTNGLGESRIMPDAVDEVAEIVLNKGGKVVFVDDGFLSKYQKIAAILRY